MGNLQVMRDWCVELAPGTMLCSKSDKSFAMVVQISIRCYAGSWTQLRLMLLEKSTLVERSYTTTDFYSHWLKVLS